MQSSEARTRVSARNAERPRPSRPSRGAMSPLLTAATTAALIPFAVVFGAGVLAWGVSRDLQRTCVVRVPGVRRVLVWVGGEVRKGVE